jgi:hypothetical protein
VSRTLGVRREIAEKIQVHADKESAAPRLGPSISGHQRSIPLIVVAHDDDNIILKIPENIGAHRKDTYNTSHVASHIIDVQERL